MGVAFINSTAGPETHMGDDDSTAHNPGQSLIAVMDPSGQGDALSRFFYESAALPKIADAPAIHILAGP
jgi:hypothetical protein